MAKKKNELLIPLLIGGGALAYYFFVMKPAQAAAPAAPTTAAGSSPLLAPGAMPGGSGYAAAPVPAANSSAFNVVQSWMTSGALDAANQKQALYQLGNMTPAEINELADIIINVWGSGKSPSSAQTLFWNTWRAKYHIDDGTYA